MALEDWTWDYSNTDTAIEKKLPSFGDPHGVNPVAVAETTVNGVKLTVYENWYAVYAVDSARTVMAVDCCGDYRYDFTDGTDQIIPTEKLAIAPLVVS